MGAVLVTARAGLSSRWRSTVLLAVLVGLAGGVVLAAVAGARRTDRALPAFLKYHRPADVSVFLPFDPTRAPAESADFHRRVGELPMVAGWAHGSAAVLALPESEGREAPFAVIVATAVIAGDLGTGVDRLRVVEGRDARPEKAEEATIDETLADAFDLAPGDTFTVGTLAPEQVETAGNGEPLEPGGEQIALTITGVTRGPRDLVVDPNAQPGTIYVSNSSSLRLTPAWWARHGEGIASYGDGSWVRLERGRDDLPTFERAVKDLAGGAPVAFDLEGDRAELDAVRQSIDLTVTALYAFAAVAAVAAAIVVGQALARQAVAETAEGPVLAAIGMTRAALVGAAALRAAVVGVAGAVVAVVVAAAASPLTPVGIARQAELDPGIEPDGWVFVIGVLAVVVVVVVRMAVAVVLASRRQRARTPSAAGARPSAVGAPPALLLGVRMVSVGGRGAPAAAARTAVIGVLAGVVAVAAALVVGGSLDRLLTRPDLQGWNWDVAVGNYATPERAEVGGDRLAGNPDVAEFSGVNQVTANVGAGRAALEVGILGVAAERGLVSLPVLAGRHPAAPGEIALGTATMAELGVEIGDEVPIAGTGAEPAVARVVGTVIAPAVLVSQADLDSGAVMTLEGLNLVAGFSDTAQGYAGSYLVRFAEGVDGEEAIARLRADFPGTLLGPAPPFVLENLRRVEGLGPLLAGVVGTLALGTLAHALATGVRRRRRDLAVLRALGWTRRQVGATVAWQALAFVGLVLGPGLVLGLAAGRWGWRALADSVGSDAGPASPFAALALSMVAVVAVAGLAAFWPGRAATRIEPAAALRTE